MKENRKTKTINNRGIFELIDNVIEKAAMIIPFRDIIAFHKLYLNCSESLIALSILILNSSINKS